MDVESNLTLNSNAELSYTTISPRVIQEIIATIFLVVVMFVDVVLFYIIFTHKRLRTVPNIFFANWAIADLLCVMVAPNGYRIMTVIGKNSISHEFLCFIEEFGATFHVTVNLFIIVVLIDWFIAAYFGRASEKFRDNYLWIIGCIWTTCIVFGSTSSAICFHYYSDFVHHMVSLLGTYILITLLVIILQISRIVQKCRHSYVASPTLNLTFGTVFVICALLTVLQMIGAIITTYNSILKVFIVITMFGTNIINLIIMSMCNQEFKCCLLSTIRCKAIQEESLSEFNNPIKIENHKRLESEASSTGSQEFLTHIA